MSFGNGNNAFYTVNIAFVDVIFVSGFRTDDSADLIFAADFSRNVAVVNLNHRRTGRALCVVAAARNAADSVAGRNNFADERAVGNIAGAHGLTLHTDKSANIISAINGCVAHAIFYGSVECTRKRTNVVLMVENAYKRIGLCGITEVAPSAIVADGNALFNNAVPDRNIVCAGSIAAEETGSQHLSSGFNGNIFNVNNFALFGILSGIGAVRTIVDNIFVEKSVAVDVFAFDFKILHSCVACIFKQAFAVVGNNKGVTMTVNNSCKRQQALTLVVLFAAFFKSADGFPVCGNRNIVSERNGLSGEVVRLTVFAFYHAFYILEFFLIMYKERICGRAGAFQSGNKSADFGECNCNRLSRSAYGIIAFNGAGYNCVIIVSTQNRLRRQHSFIHIASSNTFVSFTHFCYKDSAFGFIFLRRPLIYRSYQPWY